MLMPITIVTFKALPELTKVLGVEELGDALADAVLLRINEGTIEYFDGEEYSAISNEFLLCLTLFAWEKA